MRSLAASVVLLSGLGLATIGGSASSAAVPMAASAERFHVTAMRDSVAGGPITFISEMHGTAAGLGPFTGVATISCYGHRCFGPAVLTTAGGDQIEFFTQVRFDPQYVVGEGTYTVSGGTGRFAGASGSGYFSVDHTQSYLNAVITWDGTLAR